MGESYRCGHCKQEKGAGDFNPSQRSNGKWCKACLRSDYRAKRPALLPRPCEVCGTLIEEPKPKSRFCSTRCKNAARIAVDTARRLAAKAERRCQVCGTSIAHMRGNAKWCSTACTGKRPAAKVIRRRAMLKANYGITPEAYDAMLAAQGGRCAVCRGEEPHAAHHNLFAVDHDHITGKVRGLLCAKCNTGIGQLRDDPDLLIAAAAYVRRHREE